MRWYESKELPTIKKVKNKLKLNKKLLKSLLLFQSPSKTQEMLNFRDWVKNYVNKIPNVSTKLDEYGNLYVTKGSSDIYPCVVAHLDTNQDIYKGMTILEINNIMFGFDKSTGKQCGLGADDKNGVYIALEMLKRFDNIKCFLPLDEEVGCKGTKEADYTFFNDCSFIAQPDRRNYTTDFITNTNGIEVCNENFYNLFKNLFKKYGYSTNTGVYTDIGEIKKSDIVNIPAFNYSCGYLNEHCENEIILTDALENALNFIFELITCHGYTKHYHKSEIKKYDDFYYSLDKEYTLWNQEELEEENTIKFECEHFQFSESYQDLKWIEDCLEIGECPYCQSHLNDKYDKEKQIVYADCKNCNSKWDIQNVEELQEQD